MGRQPEEDTARDRYINTRVTKTFGKRLDKAAKADGGVGPYLRRLAREDMDKRGV